MLINDENSKKRKIVKLKVTAAKTEEKPLCISSEFIKLDSALKLAGIAQTGGHAKIIVGEGGIRINGEICSQRGKKLYPGDKMQYGKLIFTVEKIVK